MIFLSPFVLRLLLFFRVESQQRKAAQILQEKAEYDRMLEAHRAQQKKDEEASKEAAIERASHRQELLVSIISCFTPTCGGDG